MIRFTEDDFSAWRDLEITQALFAALRMKADEACGKWLSKSWDGGDCDERLLADLRARAQIATDICDLTFEELEAILEPEHERDSPDRL